ncbi:hypothetical protein MNB_SV-14-1081 [hydrothermal vent metagenome]|uniref:Uncharacterized protein n=1 Tax=hydrothermal vent metagenome TaxID=652676 RepID=A0A1W1CN27_9ZZZZ
MKRIIKICMTATVVLTSHAVAEFNFDKAPTKLTAYYLAGIQSIAEIKAKLALNDFRVLATNTILKDKTVITITNNELKATNSYMATLHILVNKKDNEVRVQNPSYLASAYIKGYKYGDFKETLNSLEKVLSTMVPVLQQKDMKELPEYHFMFGMPYLEDTITVAKDVSSPNASKISYSLKLPNGAILVGHKLSKKTNNFLNKINQSKNVQLLPYESMIKDGKATILDPKYYLALSLPNLTMGEFMKIATTPDSIEKEIEKSYR